ncbi:MAG TPA: hypothetical protein VFA78_08370 [Chloroflexota bacterium]|nr:hypothetical protein [Chloroflexota bacterium]
MTKSVQMSDDGEIEAGWEIPNQRIEFAVYGTLITPVGVALALSRVFRHRLTETQQEVATELLALPLFAASALVSWKVAGLFWPNRPLSNEEFDEWRRNPPGSCPVEWGN